MLDNTLNQEPALQFEGQYNFGSEADRDIYTERTISLWFKVDETTLDREQVIYEEDGATRGLDIYVEDGRLFFNVWNQVGSDWSGSYSATDAIASNTWHHISLVIDREQDLESDRPFTAYLDGIDIDEGEGAQPDRVNVGVGGLNQSDGQEEQLPQGNDLGYSIKNVQVYDRALTTEEITLLFNPNYDPEPVNDTTVTVENTEVILLGSKLLDNDTDPNGDRLSISGVGNATNGSVAQDSEGNVIFTPEFNFSGEASFEYIVSDGVGGSETATVTVDVLAETKSVPIGTNLHSLKEVSPELPFLNGLKTAPGWLTQDFGVNTDDQGNFINVWNTAENNLLDLDEDGWVKSLPAPEDDPQYSSVGVLLYRNLDYYPEGKYVVLYEGEGTLQYQFDAQKDESTSTPGRDVLDVNPTSNGIWLRIIDTDPNDTGDYIRNIRVIPEAYEDLAEQTYNPDFLNTIQNFDTLRYLDWMGTNSSQESEWSDRSIPDRSIFSENLVSIEEMVELANQTQTNPWFNIPHMATDEYITNFAEYVKDNLDPNLQVYVEYSHEVWNSNYDQARWIRQQGENEWPDSLVNSFGKRLNWYSRRTTEVTQIWDEVFDSDKERVIGVIGGQAANTATIARALEYNWTENPLTNEEYGIDAIAISPYTASYLINPENEAEIASWTEESDGGLDKFFTELTEGGVLTNSPQGGAFQQAYDYTQTYVDIAEAENLDLITYEVGQTLPVNYGGENNQAIKDLFDAAKADPRIEGLYQEYFTTLSEMGVDLSTSFNNPDAYNQWGSWWELNSNNLEGSAKLDAITSLIAENTHFLPPQLGVLENNLSQLNLIVEGDSLEINTNYTDVNGEEGHNLEFDWGDGSEIVSEDREPLLGEIGNISASHIYNTEGNYTATLTLTDEENLTAKDSIAVSVAKKIGIDWRPYSTSQQTNLAGNGEVRVAIFGTSEFEVDDLDPTSIRADDNKNVLLNGNGVATLDGQTDLQDINSDGFQDLILSFDKSILSSAVETNAESMIDDDRIYLFGNSSQLDSNFFFGME